MTHPLPVQRLRHSTGNALGGFTLLETMIAMGVFLLLFTAIFGISQATINLSDDLSSAQERSLLRQNFIEFVRRSFRNLPGGAEVRLNVKQVGSSYMPTINVVNGDTSFTPGGSLPPNTSAEMFAEERPGGFMRIGLRTLDERQTQSLRSGQSVRVSRGQPIIVILDNVTRFEWRFYDHTTKRWETNWRHGRRPTLAEMNLRLDDGFETRAVFWIPPLQPNGIVTGVAPMVGQPLVPGDPNAPGGDDPNNPGDPNDPNPSPSPSPGNP